MFEFKIPDVKQFGATPEQERIATRYLRVRRVIVADEPDAHLVWLGTVTRDARTFGWRLGRRPTRVQAEEACLEISKFLVALMQAEKDCAI